jgi:hypothetical protein
VTEDQVRIVVRRSIAGLEEEIRRRHAISSKLLEVSIEKDAVLFTFAKGQPSDVAPMKRPKSSYPDGIRIETQQEGRRRRKRRVRNRIKTKGWDVLAKIINSRGQTCTIYRPIYEALHQEGLNKRDSYAVVRRILVANGNDPSPSSVEYFLENTLEYIAKSSGESSHVEATKQ